MARDASVSKSPIASLIDDYVSRGVFRAAALASQRNGVEAFRLIWFQRQEMTLTIDLKRREARLSGVLPSIASRSAFDRQLRAWLRERSASHLPAHRRIDPIELQARLTNRAGRVQLAIVSANGDLLHATRKLLHLTNELYLDFLSAPQSYSWIVETFELDPDNPRWP
jgi:hypothetical protein